MRSFRSEDCNGRTNDLHLTDLSPVCVLRRILREIPMILAMGLIAAMLTLTAAQCLYQPEYTASATVAVNAKTQATPLSFPT